MPSSSNIRSSCFRELQGYSLKEVKDRLRCSEDETRRFLNYLRQHGIVKVVRKDKKDYSDITNEDILFVDDAEGSEGCYKFDFVGVIVVGIRLADNKGLEKVICCYPKYVVESSENSLEEHKEDFKRVLRAIQKYDSDCELVHLYNGSDKGSFNRLALALHILYDYYENGIYSNTEQIIETNGDGEIEWDRTINETFAYLKNNRPYYLELKTIANQNDDYDYFKRLHECVVTECSDYLENLGVLDLFELNPVRLTDTSLEDFGERTYIEYRLEREIASQFVTRKQNQLKTLYTYIAEKHTDQVSDNFSVYGTNSLNLVWEKACGAILENIYSDIEKYLQNQSPKWYFEGRLIETNNPLIPDIVSKCMLNDSTHDEVFCILDAKYYLLNVSEKSVTGNPGVQDVVKQFVYHKALMDYVKSSYKTALNAFLFPSVLGEETCDIDVRGNVTMMDWGTKDSELVPVYLMFLKTAFVWNSYLNGRKCKSELVDALKNIRFENVYKGLFTENSRNS